MMSKDRKERDGGEEGAKVDATGVTSMLLLLRVTRDGKSLGNAAKSRQTAAKTGAGRAARGPGHLAAELGRFVNEQGSLSG